jgi:hypothetical protein
MSLGALCLAVTLAGRAAGQQRLAARRGMVMP